MILHEATVLGQIDRFIQKSIARFKEYQGWSLDLRIDQLPSLSRMDLARTALEELEACPRLNQKLINKLKKTLEVIYEALIIPDLELRNQRLIKAGNILNTDPTILTSTTRTKKQRDSMYESSDRVEVVTAHLDSAIFQLDCCYRNTYNCLAWAKTNPEKNIEETLSATIDKILSARDNMPMLDIEGW